MRSASLLLVSLLLAACATTPPPAMEEAGIGWEPHHQQLEELENWSFSGKIAVRQGDEADSARLRWTQRGEQLRVEISGPIGFKQMLVESDGGSGRVYRDGRWTELKEGQWRLERELGWPLPLDLLPWWLRGIPAPGVAPDELKLVQGRLALLRQADWQLEYSEYQAVNQPGDAAESGSVELPSLIRFEHRELSGKILLKRWRLDNE